MYQTRTLKERMILDSSPIFANFGFINLPIFQPLLWTQQ